MQPAWIELEGLVNLRDVGGIRTVDGGEIATGRLLRSDNLQSLTAADIEALLDLGLTDVIDLRSAYEVHSEGPGPMTVTESVTIHHFSLFRDDPSTSSGQLPAAALPWVGLVPSVRVGDEFASSYLSFLQDRPDSVVAALRTIAGADGASLVHCAAGKDRTGTIVALALLIAGAAPDAVVADYAATNERIGRIVDRLMSSPTYADNLRGRTLATHEARPETMRAFVDHLDQEHGGIHGLLDQIGWSSADTDAMKSKLLA